jgi:hypothetical protein
MAAEDVQRMFQMVTGYWVTQITGTLSILGVPDRLAAGPRRPGEIAAEVGAHPDALSRLMRAAASLGIFAARPDGAYALTDLGRTLTSDAPVSFKNLAIMNASPGHWLPWGRFADVVRQGRRQAAEALGSEVFEYYATQPDEAAAFSHAMSDLSAMVASEVARVVDTSGASKVIDVGGANGTLVAALLHANPRLTGAILELPHAVDGAQAAIERRGLADRCRAVGGDFFQAVPPADLYVLKHILHDWDDAQCATILGNCAASLAPGGQVVIVEMVLPEDGRPSVAPLMDVNMLALAPGRERTAAEYTGLCREAGLTLGPVIETASPMQVMVARRA